MHDGIYDNICHVMVEPLVRLNRIPKDGWAEMLVKLESFKRWNRPMGPHGLSMIESANGMSALKPAAPSLTRPSVNTGIGLAMVRSSESYLVILTMPED